MVSFINTAEAVGFSTNDAQSVNNWGQINAKKAGINSALALQVQNIFQGNALIASINVYGNPDTFVFGEFSQFSNHIQVKAFEELVNSNLITTKTADISIVTSFTLLQLEALKVINKRSILTSGQVAAAQQYDTKTKLLELQTTLNHLSAIATTITDPEVDDVEPATEEWNSLVNKRKIQIVRNVQASKIDTPGNGLSLTDTTISVDFSGVITDAGAGNTPITSFSQLMGSSNIGGAVIPAIKTVQDNIGTLTSLETSAQSSLVAAINEVRGAIGFTVAGDGLTNPDSTTININLETSNPGLQITSDKLDAKIDATKGLQATAAGTAINNGNGLIFNAGALTVGKGNGITVNNNDITIDLRDIEPGLEVGASGVAISLKGSNGSVEKHQKFM